MKTNYVLLIFNFIISIFMLLSLNSFTTSTMYLPALFLYFLSNIATFIDKFMYYKNLELSAEKWLSLLCFLLSIGMICIYIADSLGFVKITFQNACGSYRMLIQGVPNSFFTFNSIDITTPTFIIASIIPIAYIFFTASTFLRELGLTKNKISNIIKHNKKFLLIIPTLSLFVGLLSVQFCHSKYLNTYKGFGKPQYLKYFFTFFLLALVLFTLFFLVFNRNKEYK